MKYTNDEFEKHEQRWDAITRGERPVCMDDRPSTHQEMFDTAFLALKDKWIRIETDDGRKIVARITNDNTSPVTVELGVGSNKQMLRDIQTFARDIGMSELSDKQIKRYCKIFKDNAPVFYQDDVTIDEASKTASRTANSIGSMQKKVNNLRKQIKSIKREMEPYEATQTVLRRRLDMGGLNVNERHDVLLQINAISKMIEKYARDIKRIESEQDAFRAAKRKLCKAYTNAVASAAGNTDTVARGQV
jgi:hypothetical protein